MISGKFLLIFAFLLMPLLFSNAYAHTVDAIAEKYRIEIGWMNEPVVSGETNGIELYISHLVACPEISEAIKCAEAQEFQNGIEDLEKDLKLQLVYKTDKITLSLKPDHNIPGKYYAYVDPTTPGYYQANLIGTLLDTPVSLSMHPPKVDDKTYIEFPQKEDAFHDQILEEHDTLVEDLEMIKTDIQQLKESNQMANLGYAGIGLGITGIAIASVALAKSKK